MVVNEDRYPYFALKNGNAMCGAVLIGNRFVLTAAHCQGAADQFFIGARTSNRVGRATVKWQDFLVHPDYLSTDFDNDIMLFYLDEEVSGIPALKLGKDPVTQAGTQLTVIGFGDTRGSGIGRLFLSDVLQEAVVAYVDPQTCAAAHAGDPVTEDMLCAAESNTDACFGDSGGPLIKKGGSIQTDELVGLVSWGRGCADPNYPGGECGVQRA
ncbi:MAG: hypothetical protein SGARI_002201 [Bacillariaceae sp.]